MRPEEREEVRTMLHDILAGYQALNESNIEVTNNSLQKIDEHLTKLNSKVAEHEKVINIHLPHNISHCPQNLEIALLKENMISAKAIRGAVYRGIGGAAALMSIVFVVYKLIVE